MSASWFPALLVTFAGFCSLVYQVVWERVVKYSFGADSTSAAIVTGTFLLGLGIGAAAFGRWRRHAFTVFAVVEAALGAWAIASYDVLAPLATLLGRLFSVSILDAEGLRAPVVIACILFLLPPCILMGGTLPLMFNCFIRPEESRNSPIGLLYGLNTLGAALGVIAAPLLFLNRRSIPSTLVTVGIGNVLLGIAIWWYGRRVPPLVEAPAAVEPPPEKSAASLPMVVGLAFVSGFIALAFEVSLFRAIGIINPSSPYNFPGVLMPFLVSIAVGSIVLTRFGDYSVARSLRRVGVLFVLAAVGMLVGIVGSVGLTQAGFREAFRQTPFGWTNHLPGLLLYGAVLVVPFAFFGSGVFPLLLRLASPTGRSLPATTGLVSLVNALGAFAGAMLAQFAAFPALGTRGVLTGLVLLGALAGAWCLVTATSSRRELVLSLAMVPVLGAAPFLVPPLVWDLYTFGITGPTVQRVEGTTGVATIDWGRFRGRVAVNGQSMSALPDHPIHVQLVSFALSLPRRDHVLLLGLGGGGMVRELAKDAGVKRVDVVDWSYELPRVLDTPRAKEMLEDILRSPKVRLCRCDARVAVSLYEPRSFDIVIDNLTHAHWVGATGVKSLTYFRKIRAIVKPSGVFVYHGNYGPAREAILAGLVRSFPLVREHGSRVVFASEQPVELDPARVQAVLEPRATEIGLAPPYADWLLNDWRAISRHDLPVGPVRDHVLAYEYQLDPLGRLLGLTRPR